MLVWFFDTIGSAIPNRANAVSDVASRSMPILTPVYMRPEFEACHLMSIAPPPSEKRPLLVPSQTVTLTATRRLRAHAPAVMAIPATPSHMTSPNRVQARPPQHRQRGRPRVLRPH